MRKGWRIASWAWVVMMNLIGWGLFLYPIIFYDDEPLPGQGTAMLLIAATLLFAVVSNTWDWRNNRLVTFASFSTAVFGFLGTSYTLVEENPPLLTVLGIVSLYSVGAGLMLTFPVAYIARRIKGGVSRRRGDAGLARPGSGR